MTARRLLLITQSFPWGNRTDFLEDEVFALAEHFSEIVIAPTAPVGEPAPLPPNVTVDRTLAPLLTRRGRMRALVSQFALRLLVSEVRTHWRKLADPRVLVRAMLSAGGAAAVARWYHTACGQARPDLAYTYWLTGSVVGVRAADPSIPIVSRIHGGDLFLERHARNYIPLHLRSLASCSAVASVSERGHDYLLHHYPQLESRLVVRRLGTQAFNRAHRSADGVLRVVTCASLTPVKRPLLGAESIIELSRHRPVRWDHFGDGPLAEELKALMTRSARPGLDVQFHGAVPNSVVADHYAAQPVDVLLNTSHSEGVPVSMMEALSAGVPVVATAVGGTPEIIREGNGRLVAADASPKVIAEALSEVGDNPGSGDDRVEFWAENYDASSNDHAFAAWLLDIVANGEV